MRAEEEQEQLDKGIERKPAGSHGDMPLIRIGSHPGQL